MHANTEKYPLILSKINWASKLLYWADSAASAAMNPKQCCQPCLGLFCRLQNACQCSKRRGKEMFWNPADENQAGLTTLLEILVQQRQQSYWLTTGTLVPTGFLSGSTIIFLYFHQERKLNFCRRWKAYSPTSQERMPQVIQIRVNKASILTLVQLVYAEDQLYHLPSFLPTPPPTPNGLEFKEVVTHGKKKDPVPFKARYTA